MPSWDAALRLGMTAGKNVSVGASKMGKKQRSMKNHTPSTGEERTEKESEEAY